MEKVIIISGTHYTDLRNEAKVNVYLDQGWSVKTIHTTTSKDVVTIIFVLEK